MPGRRKTGFGFVGAVTASLFLLSGGLAHAATTQKPKANRIGYSSFSSCDSFLKYIRPVALESVGPYRFNSFYGGPRTTVKKNTKGSPPSTVAAPAPVEEPAAAAKAASNDTSTTNVQEAGVDEGDLVELGLRNLGHC